MLSHAPDVKFRIRPTAQLTMSQKSRARFRSREDAQLRAGLPLGKSGDRFYGTIGDDAVCITSSARTCVGNSFDGPSRPGATKCECSPNVERYFALDHPLEKICRSFPRDLVMDEARDFCRGLRIIRQPKWECLATFICSSMKQVAHIRQISQALRSRFGERKMIDATAVYTFPNATRLATSENELRACALGYRAKNLRATARLVAAAKRISRIGQRCRMMNCVQLCELPGVGPKWQTASCCLPTNACARSRSMSGSSGF